MIYKDMLRPLIMSTTTMLMISTTVLASNHVSADQNEKLNINPNHMPKGFYATLGLGFSAPQPTSGNTPTHYGYVIHGDVYKATGFSGETGGGYDLGPARIEITYGYTKNSLKTSKASASGITEQADLIGSMTNQTVLISAYYDLYTNSHYAPYIGGGIGYGNIAQSYVTFNLPYGTGFSDATNKSVFAYRAKVGVTYMASQKVDLFAEGVYQGSTAYVGSGGFAPGSCNIGPSNDFGAKAGVRYHFV